MAAWVGGAGTGQTSYFTFEDGIFSTSFSVPDALREAALDLVEELVEWRLAEYLRRSPQTQGPDRFVCRVSHAGGRPMLFLPDRDKTPGLPIGWRGPDQSDGQGGLPGRGEELAGSSPHDLIRIAEVRNILTTARIILHSSLARKASSRELHFKRLDYPEVDPPGWRKFTTVRPTEDGVAYGELPLDYYGSIPDEYERHNRAYIDAGSRR